MICIVPAQISCFFNPIATLAQSRRALHRARSQIQSLPQLWSDGSFICSGEQVSRSIKASQNPNNSHAITEWIRANMANPGQDSTHSTYWLALRKHCLHCNWEWNDRSVFSYTNWAQGEPQDENDEDCVRAYEFPPDSCKSKLR